MVNRITIWCGCFCISAVGSVFWPILPPLSLQFILASVGLIAFYPVIKPQCLCTLEQNGKNSLIICMCIALSGALVGALWVASVGYRHQSWQLPEAKIQQDVTIKAKVVHGGCVQAQQITSSQPIVFNSYTVLVSHLDGVMLVTPQRFKLTERSPGNCLHAGDVFDAQVKIKPAYGTLNPVGFNRQQYLTSREIVATGYIKRIDEADVIHQHNFRYAISSFLAQLPLVHMQWFQALLLGERGLLSPDDWQLIQRTGTAHIFSISGMHLGIIAMAVFYLCGGVVFLFRLSVGERATITSFRTLILIAVLMCGAAYMVLSGMALPVIRAFILLSIASGFAIFKHALRPAHIAIIMVFICIVLFPLSLLQASFYLSVGAVLCIWLLNWRFHLHAMPWYKAALLIQIGVSIVMAPVTMLWFGSASIIGIVANIIVLPVITFLLPVALIMLLVAYFFACVITNDTIYSMAIQGLQGVDVILGALISFLETMASHPYSAIALYPKVGAVLCLLCALLLVVLPRWRFQRLSIMVLLIPIVLTGLPYSSSGWYMHVFDAGQGSALAITRGRHTLIIDSGPAYEGKAYVAQQIIPAFLNQNNSLDIDLVIHSHGDLDHAGGKKALKHWLDNLGVYPEWISPTQGCTQGRVIPWHGLSISFLWPLKGNKQDNNEMSCVVKISDGLHSVLLPGDIERTTEYAILAGSANVAANIMVAPHHGSKTSSTDIWIRRVNPDVVIYTQGNENRWKFPNKAVYERYERHGISQFTTSEFGYIRVEFTKADYIVTSARGQHNRRWYLPAVVPRHIKTP